MEMLDEKELETREVAVKDIEKLKEKKGFYKIVKRVIDIVLSLIGMILLSPVFLIISIIIKLDS